MIENLPNYIAIVFGLITLATFVLFYLSIKKSVYSSKAVPIGIGIIAWLLLQMVLSMKLFYVNTVGNVPPPFALIGFVPTFIVMIILLTTKKGQLFVDSLPLGNLTFLSIIRIPVEIVLWWLFLQKMIPELMTFEGRNFDILAGITAPFIAYFGFVTKQLNKKMILLWNIGSLLLLINILINAMFSFPTAFQQQAFDQPNIGILYFPFIWLPTFVAPLVFFTHLISIRQLLKKEKN